MIGKLKGMIDSYGEDFIILDVQRRRLSGALLGAHPAGAAGAGRGRDARDRDPCARGPDPAVRLSVATASANGSGCCRPCRASAPRWRSRCSARSSRADLASAIAMGDKAAIRRAPGVGPKVAERIVTELKDKAPAYSDLDPGDDPPSGRVRDKRAPQPVRDAVSALVNLGYGQPQAAAAIAAASAKRARARNRAA